MRDALDRCDLKTIASLGHSMRGAGGMFGFPAITEFCAALEQAAENADTNESRRWIVELAQYLDHVDIISD
jgi:HPt (histidine-containing phosphotransfer) domain-containing protein